MLLKRAKPPNAGLYSPIGGKLETGTGESPAQCAQREIREEAGIDVPIDRLKLRLIVSEQAFEGTHWLMFVYRVLGAVEVEEHEIREGRLEWKRLDELASLPMPATDAEHIWPAIHAHENGFGTMHLDCRSRPIRARIEQTERIFG